MKVLALLLDLGAVFGECKSVQFFLDGGELGAILELVLLSSGQGLPKLWAARESHGAEVVGNNGPDRIAKVAALAVGSGVPWCIELMIRAFAAVSSLLHTLRSRIKIACRPGQSLERSYAKPSRVTYRLGEWSLL